MPKSLPEETHRLTEDLLKLLENGSSNDLTIILEDGELRANKDILMARCPYFATMLNNQNFVESKTNTIKMMTGDKKTMMRVLRYIFSGDIEALSNGLSLYHLIKLMDLSRLLLLDQAFFKAEQKTFKVIDNINKDHENNEEILKFYEDEAWYVGVVESLKLCHELKLEEVFQMCLDVLCKHVGMILRSQVEREDFETIPCLILKAFLENPVGNLADKVDAFKDWFNSNEERMEKEEKIEILKYQLELVSSSLKKQCDQCGQHECINEANDNQDQLNNS